MTRSCGRYWYQRNVLCNAQCPTVCHLEELNVNCYVWVSLVLLLGHSVALINCSSSLPLVIFICMFLLVVILIKCGHWEKMERKSPPRLNTYCKTSYNNLLLLYNAGFCPAKRWGDIRVGTNLRWRTPIKASTSKHWTQFSSAATGSIKMTCYLF